MLAADDAPQGAGPELGKPVSNVVSADQHASESNSAAQATVKATKPRRRHLIRLFFEKRRQSKHPRSGTSDSAGTSPSSSDGPYVSGLPHRLHPLPYNLSSCPICLGDYEAPPLMSESKELSKAELKKRIEELEPLNLLPCNHAIHKDCLGPWLATSGECSCEALRSLAR